MTIRTVPPDEHKRRSAAAKLMWKRWRAERRKNWRLWKEKRA